MNNHHPAAFADLGETLRPTSQFAYAFLAKKNAISNTTIAPTPMATSRVDVSLLVVIAMEASEV
jgi:hypothetical protein